MPEESNRTVFSGTESEAHQSGDKISYFYESGAIGPKGDLKITLDERVKEAAFQLGFEDPVIAKIIAHQGCCYLNTEPMKVAGFLDSNRRCDNRNGCLRFARGSHKSGVHREIHKKS
ncbi:hypothetical protein NQ314_019798 [Rhamnusium bicolor]|uniref:Uncharacterized protein n=1 Tax=Rhamnusium bicolor TaxID=1586634 RepID=A0AAV8WNF9_9CUCU|nr:hypothetical protein NQ314_019798 [Rhamnusium bicolor]